MLAPKGVCPVIFFLPQELYLILMKINLCELFTTGHN